MISKDHSKVSVRKQCGLLDLHRSGIYYKIRGESEFNLKLMELMDKHYLLYPFKGARRMYTWLIKDKGYKINRKRVDRLYYDVMGLRSVLPGKHTSIRCKDHKVYPYLLRDLKIERPNQVWAMDITYIPMAKGFMYLTAIIDLYSRYVVGWSVSNTMDAEWCAQLVSQTIEQHGCPQIMNTDQGSQFTSDVFVNTILGNDIKLSMDGKGRATDNAFIERLWRSVKYEKLYLSPPENGIDLYDQLDYYFRYYNYERRHSSIEDNYPVQLHENKELKVVA